MRYVIALACIATVVFFGCHKKSDDDGGSSTDASGKLILDPDAPVDPQVVPFDASASEKPNMTVAGQLVVDTTSLATVVPDKVLVVPLYRGQLSLEGDTGNFKDIKTFDVNATTGRFTVDLPRVDPYLAVANELLAMSDGQLTDDVVASKMPLTILLGSTDDPSLPTRTLLKNVKAITESGKGRSYILVGMTSHSGDVEAEASSMRFIGMPTDGANLMMMFPSLAKGHILYGDITIGSTDDMRSALKIDDSVFDIPTTTLSEIAFIGRSLKGLKNVYMNYNATTQGTALPQTRFSWTAKGIAATGSFTQPQDYVYQGYGTRVMVSNNAALTVDKICNVTTGNLKFYPPTTISMGNLGSFGPDSPLDNSGTGAPETSDGGGQSCRTAKGGFSADLFSAGSKLRYAELDFGGVAQGDVPVGYWHVTLDGETIARFDVGTGAPIQGGVTLIPVPVFAVIADASGNVTSMDTKFYLQNANKTWSEITDLGVFDDVHMFFEASVTGSEAEVNHLFQPTKVGNVVRFASDKFENVAFKAPGTSGNIVSGFSISYDLFGQHYRFELRKEKEIQTGLQDWATINLRPKTVR